MENLASYLFVASVLALAGCKQEQAPGVYVEISLKNDTDIDKYVVFNPNIKTIEECEATFAGSLPPSWPTCHKPSRKTRLQRDGNVL